MQDSQMSTHASVINRAKGGAADGEEAERAAAGTAGLT